MHKAECLLYNHVNCCIYGDYVRCNFGFIPFFRGIVSKE